MSADALNMGNTAERIHDRFPQLTKERADRFALASQQKAAAAYDNGKIQPDLIPVAIRSDAGWGLATRDEAQRPETTMEGPAGLKTPFRPHGRVTAGNASGLNDGATASILASADAAKEFGLTPKMRMVSFAFAGVEPEIIGIGPVPSTEKALRKAGLSIDDIGLFELNEAFAVHCPLTPLSINSIVHCPLTVNCPLTVHCPLIPLLPDLNPRTVGRADIVKVAVQSDRIK